MQSPQLLQTAGVFENALNFIQETEQPIDFLDVFMEFQRERDNLRPLESYPKTKKQPQNKLLLPLENTTPQLSKERYYFPRNLNQTKQQHPSFQQTLEEQKLTYNLQDSTNKSINHPNLTISDKQNYQNSKEQFLEQHSFTKQRINQISFFHQPIVKSPKTIRDYSADNQIIQFSSLKNFNNNPYSLSSSRKMLKNNFNLTIQPCQDPSKKWIVKRIIKKKKDNHHQNITLRDINDNNILDNTILNEINSEDKHTDKSIKEQVQDQNKTDNNNNIDPGLISSSSSQEQGLLFEQLCGGKSIKDKFHSNGSLVDLNMLLSSSSQFLQKTIVSPKDIPQNRFSTTHDSFNKKFKIKQKPTNKLTLMSQLKNNQLSSQEYQLKSTPSNIIHQNMSKELYFTSQNITGNSIKGNQLHENHKDQLAKSHVTTTKNELFKSPRLSSQAKLAVITLPNFKMPSRIPSSNGVNQTQQKEAIQKYKLDLSQKTLPIFCLNFHKALQTRLILNNYGV